MLWRCLSSSVHNWNNGFCYSFLALAIIYEEIEYTELRKYYLEIVKKVIDFYKINEYEYYNYIIKDYHDAIKIIKEIEIFNIVKSAELFNNLIKKYN